MSHVPLQVPRARRQRGPRLFRIGATLTAACVVAAGAVAAPLGAQNRYRQTNLVSDVPGLARTTDPQLVNPWGVSFGPTSPFWVSDAGTGVSTLYNGAGTKLGLVVTIPGPGGPVPGVPTGQVFNGAGAFGLPNGNSAVFLFASATGTISGWNGGTTAVTVHNPGGGAAYTGLAIAGSGAGARLYGANFGTGRVDVFDGSFASILPGSFADPNLPAGYAPFNVQTIGSSVYVTYALKESGGSDEVPGAGNGFVSVFDTDGIFQRRLASQGALNAPWGVALAPSGFGRFGGDLLVGNFGDGTINAFDPLTGALQGQLRNPDGTPVVNEGLWALTFGNGGNGGAANRLYFTAGIDDETHGLFGSLTAVPEPATLGLVAAGVGVLAAASRRRGPTAG